jgi:hypothetical protein
MGLAAALLGVVLLNAASTGSTGPYIGDHWHAPYEVIVCGRAQPPIAEFAHSTGIHTHADGIMHLHPQTLEGEGRGASVAQFFKNSGTWVDFSYAPDGCNIAGLDPVVLRADSGIHPLGAGFNRAIVACDGKPESDFDRVDPRYVPLDGDCIRIIFGEPQS